MRKVKSQWVVVGLSAVAILGVGAGAINFNSDNDENAETTPKVKKLDEGTANKAFIGDTNSEIVENEQFDDVHEESIAIETPTDSAKAFPSNYPAGTTFGGAVPLTYQSEDKTPEVLESPTSPIPTTTAATSNQNSQTVGSIPTPESPVTASPVGTETGTGTGNIEVFPDLDEIVQPGGESTPGNTDVSDSKTEELPTEDQEITEQVTTNTIDETVSVPFDTVYVEDESLLVGEEQIIQTGTMGIIVNTYTEVIRDEVQESYLLTNTVVVSNPLNQIVHIGVKELKQETKTISTSYETVYQSDTELEKGQTEVIQVGVMGEAVETYHVTYVKGIKVAEELVGTEVVKEPVNQVIANGTKVGGIKTETVIENKVPFETTIQEYNNIPTGQLEVIQVGVDGYDTVTYEVTYMNGIETGRTETGRTTITPVDEIVRVGTQMIEMKAETTIDNIVTYTTTNVADNTFPVGQTEVIQTGVDGYDTVTYEVTYTNGVETARVETVRATITPVDEIVRVGTKIIEIPEITIDVNPFSYDEDSDSYYLYNDLNSISGIITNIEAVSQLSYQILDANKSILLTNNIKKQSNWNSGNIGFVLGMNIVEISAEMLDGSSISKEIQVLNFSEENMRLITIDDADDDGDGLINYLEGIHRTNKNLSDSDFDKLNDYYEITVTMTNPTLSDSDGDGILDGDEDNDEDGIVNAREAELGSDPDFYDTDFDGLNDKIELANGTSVFNEDTDGDGMLDNYELMYGLNPLEKDTDGDGVDDSYDSIVVTITEEDLDYYDEAVIPEITILATGGQIPSLNIKSIENNAFLSSNMPGYIGTAYELKIDGKIKSAELSFRFDPLLLGNAGFDPVIYYYNETDQLLEEVAGQRIEGNMVTVDLEHFSIYILLNRTEVNKVWDVELKETSLDSDQDGLSDYAEKNIRLGNGEIIETDPDNPDSDGDGLLDGEEVLKKEDKMGRVYYYAKSLPDKYYSDGDKYSDYAEVKTWQTDPLKDSSVILPDDIELLTDNERYIHEVFQDIYEENNLIKIGVWVYNSFGGNWSSKLLYKEILFEFMQGLTDAGNSYNSLLKALSDTEKIIAVEREDLEELVKTAGDDEEVQKAAQDLLDFPKEYYDKFGSEISDKQIMDEFRERLRILGEKITIAEVKGTTPYQGFEKIKGFLTMKEIDLAESFTGTFKKNFIDELDVGAVSLAVEGVKFFTEAHVNINNFEASYQTLLENKNILKIITDRTGVKNIKKAAQELYDIIDDQIGFEKESYKKNIYADQLIQSGSSVINEVVVSAAISAIPVYGPIAAVGMNILDATLNLSGKGEGRSHLYALAECAKLLSENLLNILPNLDLTSEEFYKVDIEMDGNVPLFFYQLAQARVKAEMFYLDNFKEVSGVLNGSVGSSGNSGTSTDSETSGNSGISNDLETSGNSGSSGYTGKFAGNDELQKEQIATNVKELEEVDDRYLLTPIGIRTTERITILAGNSVHIANREIVQMNAQISPFASGKSLIWNVEFGTGSATIDPTGLFTATSAGTVTVKVRIHDDSGVVGEKEITIYEPVSIISYKKNDSESDNDSFELTIPAFVDGSSLDDDNYWGGIKY